MASNFGTSDRWFNPAMSRTNINREYLLAATSGGYAYPNGTDAADTPLLPSQTIFEALQKAGITWKICMWDTEGEPMHRAVSGIVPDDAELPVQLSPMRRR